jgi:hypothetical protein
MGQFGSKGGLRRIVPIKKNRKGAKEYPLAQRPLLRNAAQGNPPLSPPNRKAIEFRVPANLRETHDNEHIGTTRGSVDSGCCSA